MLSRLMASAVEHADARPKWLVGLAPDARFGKRRFAQFGVGEHQQIASLMQSSAPNADRIECEDLILALLLIWNLVSLAQRLVSMSVTAVFLRHFLVWRRFGDDGLVLLG